MVSEDLTSPQTEHFVTTEPLALIVALLFSDSYLCPRAVIVRTSFVALHFEQWIDLNPSSVQVGSLSTV